MALLQDYNKLFEHTDNINKIYVNNSVVWPTGISSTPPGPDYTEPFYVENISNENETLNIVKNSDSAPTLTIEHSTDKSNWTPFENPTSTTAITLDLQPGEKVYLRCSIDNWSVNWAGPYNKITGVSKVGGNTMSLFYGSNFTGQETVFPETTRCAISNLFSGNTNLIDASKLLLPATILPNECYNRVFCDCTYLTTSPVIPDATPKDDRWFSNYYQMFTGCSSLNNVTCLLSTYPGGNVMSWWLYGVASTGTFTKAAGVTWPTGDSGIPSGWTVVEV